MSLHVYVFASEEGPVKIGISNDPRRRKSQVSSASGRVITKEFVSPPMDSCAAIERYMHSFFGDKRIRGEWFDISFDDAVAELSRVGIMSDADSWTDSDRYISGVETRNRIREFLSEGPDDENVSSFLRGVGIKAERDFDYANKIDIQIASKKIEESFSQIMDDDLMSKKFAELITPGLDEIEKKINLIKMQLNHKNETGSQSDIYGEIANDQAISRAPESHS